MLGISCIEAYLHQYPADVCGVDAEADNRIVIESADGRRAVCEPPGETSEIFLDRLARSRTGRRNVFFLEWDRCLTRSERMQDAASYGLAPSCIDAYCDQYPDEELRRNAPGHPAAIIWTDRKYPGGYFVSIQPPDETNEAFFDRLERSRHAGRNLFHEEWILRR